MRTPLTEKRSTRTTNAARSPLRGELWFGLRRGFAGDADLKNAMLILFRGGAGD